MCNFDWHYNNFFFFVCVYVDRWQLENLFPSHTTPFRTSIRNGRRHYSFEQLNILDDSSREPNKQWENGLLKSNKKNNFFLFNARQLKQQFMEWPMIKHKEKNYKFISFNGFDALFFFKSSVTLTHWWILYNHHDDSIFQLLLLYYYLSL